MADLLVTTVIASILVESRYYVIM